MENIDGIRILIRTLDADERRGINVTAARTFLCERAVAWARDHLTPNDQVERPQKASKGENA